jgi:hypothetical protein
VGKLLLDPVPRHFTVDACCVILESDPMEGSVDMKRTILVCTMIALTAIAACRRKTEEPSKQLAEAPPAAAAQPDAESSAGTSPQRAPLLSNDLGITLSSVPEPLMLAHQDDNSIQLLDRRHPRISVVVRADRTAAPLQVGRYHLEARREIDKYPRATTLDSGQIDDTPFGPAGWSAWRYEEDGEMMEIVELVSPHPTGQGVVKMWAKSPEGAAQVPQQLGSLRGLLDHIEAG